MDRSIELYDEFGQSPWLDNLKRGYITSGQLAELRDRGIRGLTSNPTIFQKAIQGSTDYDEQFRALAVDDSPVIDDYWALVLAGHPRRARGVRPGVRLLRRRRRLRQRRGRPGLAHDTRRHRGRRPRPARAHRPPEPDGQDPRRPPRACRPIRQMIAEGRNINVTLIFSLEPLRRGDGGLHQPGSRRYAGDRCADLSRVASVASFFVSRVDTEVDRRLDAIGTPEALALRGKAAVAQAQARLPAVPARRSAGRAGRRCAARGARVQRPLWASTSTKNPAYPDTLYVDDADRPRHGQHPAGRHDRGVRRPRHAGPHRRRGRRRARRRLGGAGRRRRRHGRRRRQARARRREQLPEELRRAARRAETKAAELTDH